MPSAKRTAKPKKPVETPASEAVPEVVEAAPVLESPEEPAAPPVREQPGRVPAHAPTRYETPEHPAPPPYQADGTLQEGLI